MTKTAKARNSVARARGKRSPGRPAAPKSAMPAPEKKGTAGRRSPHTGNKINQVLALLKRSGGVTLSELIKATDWQAHSVRGLLSGTVRKKMGLNVTSTKPESGERTYSIGA